MAGWLEYLEHIRHELAPEQAKEAYATLTKVLVNILRDPSNPKFRTLRKDNRLVAESLCVSIAAVSLLLIVGFEDQEGAFYCPEFTDLAEMEAVCDALGHFTMDLEQLTHPGEASKPRQPPASLTRRSNSNVVRSDADQQRDQQADQLRAARAALQLQHRAAAASHARAPPASAAATLCDDLIDLAHRASAPESLASEADLLGLSDEIQPCEGTAELKPVEGTRMPPQSNLYNFKRRTAGYAQQPQRQGLDDLQAVRQARRGNFDVFRTDPAAHMTSSAAYASPPSGSLGAVPAAPDAFPERGFASEWLSGASDRLVESTRQLSHDLSHATGRIAEQISAAASAGSKMGAGAAPPAGRFRVISRSGVLVRQGVEKDSQPVDMLHQGAEFKGLEVARSLDGTARVRLEEPLKGWLTLKACLIQRIEGGGQGGFSIYEGEALVTGTGVAGRPEPSSGTHGASLVARADGAAARDVRLLPRPS